MKKVKVFINKIKSRNYVYNEERYSESFVSNYPKSYIEKAQEKISRTVYVFWTGNNPMTPNRIKAFESITKNIGVPVNLVTPDNLNKFILPDYPLHEGYKYLSTNHKSDYLRCYFLHHFGGGYCDIKFIGKSWVKVFDKLDDNPIFLGAGYTEIGKRGVAKVDGNIGLDIRKLWHLLLGNGCIIFRPRTPFTTEWYTELHKRMDNYYEELSKNPGNIFGTNSGYPIPWTNLMGDIFHPLCLKYHEYLLHDNVMKFLPISYR